MKTSLFSLIITFLASSALAQQPANPANPANPAPPVQPPANPPAVQQQGNLPQQAQQRPQQPNLFVDQQVFQQNNLPMNGPFDTGDDAWNVR